MRRLIFALLVAGQVPLQVPSPDVIALDQELDKASKAGCDKYKDVKEKFDICIYGWYQGHDYRVKLFLEKQKDPVPLPK